MTEGKLLRWLKHEGEPITRGEPVAEIETDKVSIEIEAFASGVLRRILVGEGQTVPVGAPLGIIAATGEELAAAPRDAATAPPVARPDAPAAPPPSGERAQPVAPGAASPLARRVAQELGVDLATVQGTGPGGRISREDVLAAAQARSAARQGGSPAPPAVADSDVPLTRLQQTMGRRMVESKTQAPHFYISMQADMTDALALRYRLNEEDGKAARISVNDFVVRATARALAAYPRLNASFAGDKIIQHGAISICIAVALDDGLVTPVLHDADKKTLRELAAESAAIVERTRAGRNRPEDYDGGTFTVSNLGMYDVETFVAIINPPQAAILAVGAVQRVPAFLGEALMPRQMMALTLSADHRVVDGATGARFLAAVRNDLENPDLLVDA
jgi:pyruvate dehydrogenase E2 component (dihydrolipoamide acetyltransferase)